jgi:O-antigen/teichoic acid export membrane protein
MAQAFTVAIGFLMPRLINDSIGPVELGVWDLCWSLLIFFGASNFGVGPALTHYQVRWGAAVSGAQPRDLLPTAGALQCGLALVSGAAFCGFLYVAYRFLNDSAEAVPSSVLETIALLALTVVVLLIGDLGQSLLIANHRQETGEYLSITSDVTLAAAMTIVLIMGGGLLALASTTLVVRAVFETQRVFKALRLTETEARGVGQWSTSMALLLLRYSSKSMINGALDLVYPIGIRFALFLSAGPVALASYSRFATLQRQILRIAERSLLVLPVLASARADRGEPDQVAALSIRASRLTVLMMTPLLIIFALFGSDIVSIWMGPEFVVSGVAVLLACSIFLSLDRIVVNSVLSGINSHGRIGLMCHGCALVLCALGYLFIHPLDPLEAGGMILIAATGLALPQFVLASRRFGMGVLNRARLVYLDPVLCNVPGAAFLLFSHVLFHEQRFFAAVFMGAVGLLSVPLMHWVWVLDEDTRVRLRRLVLRSDA